jgi:hypothetical protein
MKKSVIIGIVLIVIIVGGIIIFTHDHSITTAPITDTMTSPSAGDSSAATGSQSNKATIGIGQSGVVAGTTIKINGLMQDSRCPVGVNCLTAGSFGIHTTVTKGKVVVSHDFITDAGAFSFQGYNFSIISVTPSPISGSPTIPLSAYRVTFQAVPTPPQKK